MERTTFEEFAENVFNPSRSSKNSSLDIEDGLSHRTFSVPSRPVTSSDPSAMMRLLDTHTDMRSQRNRASSAVDKAKESKLGFVIALWRRIILEVYTQNVSRICCLQTELSKEASIYHRLVPPKLASTLS